MSTRFKSEEQCHVQGPPSHEFTICHPIDVPIQEWQFLPAVQDASYTTGEGSPLSKYIDVLFPELHLWKDSDYANYVFKFSVSYDNTAVQWLDISSSDLAFGAFVPQNLSSTRVYLNFVNLGDLTPGVFTGSVIFEAFGIDANGGEYFFESKTVPVTLTITAGTSEGVVTDKEVYNLVFNKSTDTLSGDNKITVFTDTPEVVHWINQPFNFTVNHEDFPDKRILLLSLTSTPLAVGEYSQPFLISVSGVQKNVTINLQVIDDANDFTVSPAFFDFVVQQSPSEIKTGTITLENPNELNLSIAAFPSFVENVTVLDGSVTFTTKDSSTLGLGDYSGAIVIQSESVSKTININLKVVQALDSDFTGSPYYFALDKNKIQMQKTLSAAVYVKMTLQMYYKGFNDEYTETQTYDFPYFENKVEIYPGEEIQDFFIKCKDFEPLLSPNFNYKLAVVTIKITEHDEDDNQLSEYYLNNVLFAPGRKPKCYPIFTDYSERSTVSQSIVRLNFDVLGSKTDVAELFEQYQSDLVSFMPKAEVHSLNFKRNEFNEELRKFIIETNQFNFVPLPDIDDPVHVFWENQNLVFDWFTGAKKHQQEASYEHLFNTEDDNSEKYGAKFTKTITINTGWMLRSEVDLIHDLIKSRVCFIVIDEELIKAFPISKKNELWDSEKHHFQMDLEFKLISNER